MKKTISILLALSLMMAASAFALATDESAETSPPIAISPAYAYMTSLTANLSIASGGLASCDGRVNSLSASSGKLVVTLQQYKSGSWQKYDEWSTTGSISIVLNKTKYVASGYKYRVVVTATMYDSSGKVLETQSVTSPEKSY